MAARRLYVSTIAIPLLLTATVLYGQQSAVDSRATSSSSKSLTQLQQELARSRAELESKKRDNLQLAKQRRELEAEVSRLREKLLEQERSAEAVLKNSAPVVKQEQPAAE
jgi:septal ring factor EnvC (AmiA/AmiB activator)